MRSHRIGVFMLVIVLAVGFMAVQAFANPLPQSAGKSDSTPETVRVGGNVKPPVKTKDVKPVYPAIAVQSRLQGVVIIDATIGTDGKVKDTKIIRSMKVFDDAAVAAVRGFEYKPTVVDGRPVQVIMTIPVNFSLQ
jgi:periplasmic protein TonB